MINSALYRDPQMLDSKRHRTKKLKSLSDLSATKSMHAVFLTATEFPQAAVEFPIIFVNTGERLPNGRAMVSPVALLSLVPNENLRLDGRHWNARYVPAFIRRFPFLTARIDGVDEPGVFVDVAWEGFNDTEGERLFDDEGQPTDTLRRVSDFLHRFDNEQLRTRTFCEHLIQLDILKEMTADATMPNGENVKVEGFLTVDENKLNALPDAVVLELHRNGVLMLLTAHLISMSNMQDLMERKARRIGSQAPTGNAAKPSAQA